MADLSWMDNLTVGDAKLLLPAWESRAAHFKDGVDRLNAILDRDRWLQEQNDRKLDRMFPRDPVFEISEMDFDDGLTIHHESVEERDARLAEADKESITLTEGQRKFLRESRRNR